jgi:putative acetyltransferase
MEMIMSLPSDRISTKFIEELTRDDHVFVAEADTDEGAKVVGVASLHGNSLFRKRHSAGLGIAVHPSWQSRGIGKALMRALLDLADNWLMLVRVELDVFTDNDRAVGLYRSMGFQIEGTRRCAAVRDGVLADEYLMARLRPSSPYGGEKCDRSDLLPDR